MPHAKNHFKQYGQLILRIIVKTVATKCQILRLKGTKFYFRWGSVPDAAGGAYSALPDSLAEGLLLRKGEEVEEPSSDGW